MMLCSTGILGCSDSKPGPCARYLQAAQNTQSSGATIQCQGFLAAGDYEQALGACDAIYSGQLNPEGLVVVEAASAHDACIYRQLGRAAWGKGNTDLAGEWFDRSAKVFRAVGHDAGLAGALHSLYVYTWLKSQHRQALELANESLQAASRANDVDAQIVALTDLYIVFQELGSFGPAELTLQLVGERLDDSAGLSKANYFLYRGALEMSRDRYGMAAHEYDQAVAAAAGDEARSFMRSLYLNLVKANMLLDRKDVAFKHLAAAERYAETDGSASHALLYYRARMELLDGQPEASRATMLRALASDKLPTGWVWEMHYWAGKAAERAGQRDAARESYRKSIAALETERENLRFSDMKSSLQDDRRGPYEALFQLLAEDGAAQAALAVVEQAGVRAFVDGFVADSQIELPASIDRLPILQIADRVDAVQAFVAALRRSPAAHMRSIDALLAATREDVIISYFFAEEQLWAVRTTGGEAALHQIALGEDQLAALLDAYRRDPDNHDTLAALGAALLPTQWLPPNGQRLLVALDRRLSALGFASLRVDQKYLAQTHALTVIPSINTLVAMREARSSERPKSGHVVLADPRGDLPSARQEASDVARVLGTNAYVGDDANIQQLDSARDARVLHFATHSGLGHLGPWMALANGDVAASELLRLGLSPSLVVLASCMSGASDMAGLWGSLGGVFLSSGSGSALVALWSVPDAQTRRFVEAFYVAYATQPGAADALVEAQRKAIARGLAPRLWAGFVVLGGADEV